MVTIHTALEQRGSSSVDQKVFRTGKKASRSQRTAVGQLAIVSDARANANSILLYLLQNPPSPTTPVTAVQQQLQQSNNRTNQ